MIERLRLRNFRRYRDATLRFQPGVNFIEGLNNVGKTSAASAEKAAFAAIQAEAKSVGAALTAAAYEVRWNLGQDSAMPALRPGPEEAVRLGHLLGPGAAVEPHRQLRSDAGVQVRLLDAGVRAGPIHDLGIARRRLPRQ
jgi:hypothetical protein